MVDKGSIWGAAFAAIAITVTACGGSLDDGKDHITSATPPVSVAPTAVPGTGSTLTNDMALAILAKDEFAGRAYCGPQKVRWERHTDTTWSFSAFDDATRTCSEALQAAGLVTLGKCLDDSPHSKCLKREIAATGNHDAKVHNKTTEFYFTCGTLKMERVVSMTTKETNTVVVRYSRTVTQDTALIKSVEACPLIKPEPGEVERERTFQRDDAGKWTLVPLVK